MVVDVTNCQVAGGEINLSWLYEKPGKRHRGGGINPFCANVTVRSAAGEGAGDLRAAKVQDTLGKTKNGKFIGIELPRDGVGREAISQKSREFFDYGGLVDDGLLGPEAGAAKLQCADEQSEALHHKSPGRQRFAEPMLPQADRGDLSTKAF